MAHGYPEVAASRWSGPGACRLLVVVLVAAAAVQVAWFGDDCLITFRTAHNLVHGHGLCWNAGERALTNAHPLWLFLVAGAYAIGGEFFWSVLTLCTIATAAALCCLFRLAGRSTTAIVLGGLLLANSRAFADYCTSGLENTATHALLLGLAWCFTTPVTPAQRLRRCAFVAALATLNRVDLVLACAPTVLVAASAVGWRRALPILGQALSPALLWVGFAALYFGTPLPTVAYAKVMNGIPQADLIRQGAWYLLDLLQRDPLTAATLLVTPLLVLQRARPVARPLALGALLQTAYVVWVGGDFMAGRFFTPPFVMAVAAIVLVTPAWSRRAQLAAMLAVTVLAVLPGLPPPVAGTRIVPQPSPDQLPHGIGDERAFYHPCYSLFGSTHELPEPGLFTNHQRALGETRTFLDVFSIVGCRGLLAGSLVYVVDPYLCDPLLTRLPLAAAERGRWRIGHFRRRVPEGYLESLATRRNLIVHPGLQRYYGALRTIVSDPVLSPHRLRTLWSFWCGDYDEGLAAYVREAYDATPTPVVAAAQFAESAAEGTHWAHCATPRVLCEGGLRVSWPAPRTVRLLHLAVDSGEDYVVHFECNGRGLGSVTLHTLRGAHQGITNHAVPAPQVPFDTIWLVAGGSADQVAALASVRLE